jgi:hypothetical protein
MSAPAPSGDLMPFEIDEDLVRLEADIRQLKIQYEQYFGGGKKRPPNDVEWRIEQTMKRYGDRGAEMNYSQRFRFTNLTQTYAKYREIFHKRLQMHESGTTHRHFGAAAKAIEAERVRARRAASSMPAAAADSEPAQEPQQEPERVDQLYEAFREALKQSGEATEALSRDSFEQFLQQKAAQFQEKAGAGEVEFFVSIEEGKPRLKARIKS